MYRIEYVTEYRKSVTVHFSLIKLAKYNFSNEEIHRVGVYETVESFKAGCDGFSSCILPGVTYSHMRAVPISGRKDPGPS